MPHTSISRFGLILAAALVLLAGLGTSVIFLTRPQAQTAPEELGKPVMAAQIEFLADAMKRSAARIAAHPQTLACFASVSPDVCHAQAANLQALNQDATVLFVTEGQRQLLPGFLPGDTRKLLANAGRGGSGATATATIKLSRTQPGCRQSAHAGEIHQRPAPAAVACRLSGQSGGISDTTRDHAETGQGHAG